jgi:hypothetical protein
MTLDLFPDFLREHYEIHERRHAAAILFNDYPDEWRDIIEVLSGFRLLESYITTRGGSKSDVSKVIDDAFSLRGWVEDSLTTKLSITAKRSNEEEVVESQTHWIDCYKNRIGLEVEWNSKDQTYVRDLNNFRVLFDLNRLSVGVIVTRCDELQVIFDRLGRGSSYGASTTHMSKLLPRLRGGAAGAAPSSSSVSPPNSLLRGSNGASGPRTRRGIGRRCSVGERARSLWDDPRRPPLAVHE